MYAQLVFLPFLEPSVKRNSVSTYLALSSRYSALNVSGLVDFFVCLASEKSTNGVFKRHGGTVERRWLASTATFIAAA